MVHNLVWIVLFCKEYDVTQLLMCIYIYGYMVFGFWNRAVAMKKKESAFKMKKQNNHMLLTAVRRQKTCQECETPN